ncbi:hypothetical protein GM708_04870 [Vibrio cholerae]|nr:hypothetical protein [Vibrio cholerae]
MFCKGIATPQINVEIGIPLAQAGAVIRKIKDWHAEIQPRMHYSFLRAVERALAVEGGRPHWGKYFDESLYDWPALYPQWEAFRRVRESLDPQHRFANTFTAALLD